MTYTQKLIAITETLTADRTLSDLAARLESNRRQRAIDEAVNGVDFAKIELSTCQKDSNVTVMISDIESAISVLNCSLILLNTIVETDKLVETLFRCTGKENVEG